MAESLCTWLWADDAGKLVSVKGYVLDSACAFTKSLKKPSSADCAEARAKAGSPLVILLDDGTTYLPPNSCKRLNLIVRSRLELHNDARTG